VGVKAGHTIMAAPMLFLYTFILSPPCSSHHFLGLWKRQIPVKTWARPMWYALFYLHLITLL